MPYSNIDKPSKYFNTVLYTGDGTSNRAITGVGFKPDLVWHKSRSNAFNHYLTDAVRGAGYILLSNLTDTEYNGTTAFKSFDTDGFTLTQEGGFEINKSAVTYAMWNWLGANTTVSNTSGTITSTVSANTTSGFSVVTYTGTGSASDTVGHGLGVTPSVVITKRRSSGTGAFNWMFKHSSLSSNHNLLLEGTNAQTNVTTSFGSGGIANLSSSTTFGFLNGTSGNPDNANTSGATYVAYCFADVKGYSKFGSYTGNGSTDGTFIYTGFFPAFVMIKETSGSGAWRIYDSKRGQGGDNIGGNYKNALMANVSDVEESGATNNIIDSLSNGFKCRYSFDDTNGSGGSYIYMAFANSPFVSSKGIPTTAR
jgi:hypothetical protein